MPPRQRARSERGSNCTARELPAGGCSWPLAARAHDCAPHGARDEVAVKGVEPIGQLGAPRQRVRKERRAVRLRHGRPGAFGRALVAFAANGRSRH